MQLSQLVQNIPFDSELVFRVSKKDDIVSVIVQPKVEEVEYGNVTLEERDQVDSNLIAEPHNAQPRIFSQAKHRFRD